MKRGVSLLLAGVISVATSQNTTKTYGDSSVEWSTCGTIGDSRVECATIYVPYDQFASKGSSGRNFSVPMARMLVKNATQTILINPGGPGASGIDYLVLNGNAISSIVDDKYNLLSFDPRGVGRSRPLGSCNYPSSTDENVDGEKYSGGPLVKSQDTGANVYQNSGDYLANMRNYAKSCAEVSGEHGPWINTPQTAADMNDILDAIGQESMLYLGYSYGTALGFTYAQLFPERVHRMILDGVVDPAGYYHNANIGGTQDADAILRGLLEACIESRNACDLAEGFSSVDELNANLTQAIDRLALDPAAVYVNASIYAVLRDRDVRAPGIFMKLYAPLIWPQLAKALKALLQGDFLTPYLYMYGGVEPSEQSSGPARLQFSNATATQSDDSFYFITYGDSAPVDQSTRVKLSRQEIVDRYVAQPSYLAREVYDEIPFLDETWAWGRTHTFVPKDKVVTAHPVLLLSTTLDPITPLREAKALEKVMQGSVLVEQESFGHTTSSFMGRCVAIHMREYLKDGTLPPPGSKCPNTRKYFPDSNAASAIELASDDFKLDEACRKISENMPFTLHNLPSR